MQPSGSAALTPRSVRVARPLGRQGSGHSGSTQRSHNPPQSVHITIDETDDDISDYNNVVQVVVDPRELRPQPRRPSAHLDQEQTDSNPPKSLMERLSDAYSAYGGRHIVPPLVLFIYAWITAAALYIVESEHEADAWTAHQTRMADARTATIEQLMRVWGKDYLLENEHIVNVSASIFRQFELTMNLHDPPLIAWDMWGALFYVGTVYTTIGEL